MKQLMHCLVLKLVFPEGLSAGEGRQGNHSVVARDGMKRPVLRGTALAGALRHGWIDRFGSMESAPDWFGLAAEGERAQSSSPLQVPDAVLDSGKVDADAAPYRTHIAMHRHTGSVLNKGLMTLEALPPGTRTEVCLWLCEELEEGVVSEGRSFLAQLAGLVATGLSLGGNAARGIGRVELEKPGGYRVYNLSLLQEHGAWLNARRSVQEGTIPDGLQPLDAELPEQENLIIDVVLGIPRGEDLLVGDGQGLDYEMQPQRVRSADGQEYWRIPGSSLRGVFRGWCTRLAARAGLPVADSYARQKERQQAGTALTGDDLAWGFTSPQERKAIQAAIIDKDGYADLDAYEKRINCPIMQLFGSSFGKGRLHIADALSDSPIARNDSAEQKRAHVAVDRVTGGANEGFFFTNAVLTKSKFKVRITLTDPDEQEVGWLISTLRAIQVGVLRVGTGKAGGRLSLLAPPKVSGSGHEYFNAINWLEA